MAPPAFNFNVFMEKEKLATNGSNFTEWAINLRILLSAAEKQYVLEAPLGPRPLDDSPYEEKNVYLTRQEDHNLVHCGILYGLDPELQKRLSAVGIARSFQRCMLGATPRHPESTRSRKTNIYATRWWLSSGASDPERKH